MKASEVKRLNERVPQLMGTTEVVRRLGTTSGNLDKMSGLPAPCQRLIGGGIWRADVIEAFATERDARRADAIRQREEAAAMKEVAEAV